MKSIHFPAARNIGALLAMLLLLALVSGCGQKGPLVPASQAAASATKPH